MCNRLVIVILGIMLCTSCVNNSFDSQEEIWEFIKDEDNDLVHKKVVNGVEYVLTYKPTDILVMQELDEPASEKQINILRDKYDDHLYFDLTMSKNNRELLTNVVRKPNQFGDLVNILSFGLKEKIHMYTDKRDTLSMSSHIYPRMYGMTKKTSVLLVYSRNEIDNPESLTLVVEDLGFSTGEVKFKMPFKAIHKEPTLNFKIL